ncbi:MAG: diacylglycerol kinase family protein [Clostridia bacterium]|nr:diacylglycerol kinase family protein [Clostridia bacterium]
MKNCYILYNPKAGNGNGKFEAQNFDIIYCSGIQTFHFDMTKITSYKKFFEGISFTDDIVICGGDGTLNKFINSVRNLNIKQHIYYFPCGTGNDFMKDVAPGKDVVQINQYIANLPKVSINGKESLFINGVGYGIDGYCCEVGDELRLKSTKPVNYTSIAIKGLLFHYKPTNATIIVDGKKYTYNKVWIAPTMKGRYYGGGMIPTPNQKRDSNELSLMVFHGSGKLKTLCIFPSIFKGEHIKKTKNVSILTGKEITVKFDAPRPLQIDGETVKNVTEYTAKI